MNHMYINDFVDYLHVVSLDKNISVLCDAYAFSGVLCTAFGLCASVASGFQVASPRCSAKTIHADL